MTENHNKYNKGTLGWLREQQKIKAKKDGFDNIDDWLKWKVGPFNMLECKYGKDYVLWARKNKDRVPKYWLEAGCKTDKEYRNYRAQLSGFKNYNDKRNIDDWEKGKRLPRNIDNHFIKQNYDKFVDKYGKDADDWIKRKEKFDDNKKKEKVEWYKELEIKYGKEFADWAIQNENKIRKCALDAGCRSDTEYYNLCAQNRGFKNDSERSKIQGWNRGIHQSMAKNKNCSSNLGIELGEKIIGRYALPILFGGIKEEMPNNNPRFEFIVIGDFKIDVKCRCLSCKAERTPWWNFPINHNKDTDYFLLIGFNTRGWLEPMYVWLIHKDEMIKIGKKFNDEYPLWNRETFTITNSPDQLAYFKKYDVTDRLKELKDICQNFKEAVND